jgi:prepilin peptidase CpaA
MWLAFLGEHSARIVPWVVCVAGALAAAATDVRQRRIPNRLTGPMILLGIAWSVSVAGGTGMRGALLGMVVTGLPFIALWLLSGSGAGDAKLMLGIGAWLGPGNGVVALLGVALCGGVLSLAYAIAQKRFVLVLANVGWMFAWMPAVLRGRRWDQWRQIVPPAATHQRVPYGLAIFFGTCGAAAWVMTWGQ